MSLTPGSQLGSYEIQSLLGEGGMGQVYKARDGKLGREVAIKVLPASVANDPERLARFEREAKLLASLSHTNIAQIYGLEDAAVSGKGGRFLVMELAPGQDLTLRIGHGPLDLQDALPLALQITHALEAAHDRGIVHRDLKPANIKVSDEGAVKVLDFGLAKAFASGDPESASAMNSPTLTAQATAAGVILGTAAYMSPEQARGREADKRADVWAFGVVFFEMLTGSRLFQGETISDTLAAVLRQDIPWSTLPAGTPAEIRRLLGDVSSAIAKTAFTTSPTRASCSRRSCAVAARNEPFAAAHPAAPANVARARFRRGRSRRAGIRRRARPMDGTRTVSDTGGDHCSTGRPQTERRHERRRTGSRPRWPFCCLRRSFGYKDPAAVHPATRSDRAESD